MKRIVLTALSVSLVGAVAACAADDADGEATGELAATHQPEPSSRSELVNWDSAALRPDLDLNSNWRRAQSIMAHLSHYAYDGDALFASQAQAYGLRVTKPIHVRGGVVIRGASVDAWWGTSDHDKVAYLAIRGSSDFSDYVSDFFRAPTLQSGTPAVHAGFNRYVDAIWDHLESERALVCPPGAPQDQVPLWITGHSLGGAVATILAKRFADAGCNVRGVSTFGSPKPGFVGFHDWYSNTRLRDGVTLGAVTSRWVNEDDPIPCLAPGRAWEHVGQLNAITNSGELQLNVGGDGCETFAGTVGRFKKRLRKLGWATGTNFAFAVQDWLADKIVLGFICSDDTKVDDYFSLGACTLTEKTLRLRDAYGMAPGDFMTALLGVLNAGITDNHLDGEYASGIPASFDVPSHPIGDLGVSVTVKLPKAASATPPLMTERVSGQWCDGELDPRGNYWICVFNGVFGTEAELHIPLPSDFSQIVYGCSPSSHQVAEGDFRCDVYLNDNKQVTWASVL